MLLKMALLSLLRCLPSSLRRYSTAPEAYDMVVVGGGMVGLALAAAVGQTPSMSDKRVLLLEASPSTPPTTTPTQLYSNRVCALSPRSVDLLKRLNAWENITSVRAKSFTKIYVWDSCSPANISFDNFSDSELRLSPKSSGSHDFDHVTSDVTSDDVMGYIVENDVLLKSLSDEVGKLNVDVKRGVTITSLNHAQPTENDVNPLVTLDLTDGNSVSTRLLVGSDGTKSQVREMSDFEEVKWSYDQQGVVATLQLQEGLADNSVAWQRFLPDGPIALLPLSDTHSSLVWSTTSSHAKHLIQLSEDQFVNAVNTALFEEFPQDPLINVTNAFLKNFLSTIDSSSVPVKQLPPTIAGAEGRGSFPLSFSYVPKCVKPRIALIGDAAHRVHPLAGLGVNLGFNDVISLHTELLNATTTGAEWGNLPSLLSYETQAQRYNVPIMAIIEGLHRLFATSYQPVVLLRSLGLQLTGAARPIKDFIVRGTQGKK